MELTGLEQLLGEHSSNAVLDLRSPEMRPLTDWISNLAKSTSLRRVLVVPFILQISLAVGLTGWFSIRNGQRAVNEVASQLRGEITSRIQQYLQTYVETPHRINQLNANAVRLGEVNLQNLSALEQHLWYQLESFDTVTAVYIGSEQREHVAVEREDDGNFQVKVSGNSTNHEVRIYAADRPGNRIKLLRSKSNYDPRTRPWYKAAVKSGAANWGGIYKLFATPKYVLNASLPIYNDRRDLMGVAAVDFSLTGISQFLRSLRIGRSGETFILERRTGLLVGSSATQQPYVIENLKAPITQQNPVRVKATDSSDALTRQTAQYLLKQFGSFAPIADKQQLDFDIEGQRQFLQVMPLKNDQGLDWLIVVVVPEKDFLEQIQANTRTTILLCLGAFGLATILGIFTARWISQPILRLGSAAKAIAAGDLDQTVSVHSTQEVNGLAQSFNQMAQQLRESFSALEQTNEELEVRVEQRTAELHQAKETADAANLAKSQFLSNMSHELRTPLNIILGFTQLMTRSRSLNPKQQDYLDTINRSGEDLLTLINDVLEMSKIEAGRVILNETNFDLYALLDRLHQMFQFKARSKSLKLVVGRSNNLPQYICTDESKLRQVLVNLLGNAIKFTQTGSVTLLVKMEHWEPTLDHPLMPSRPQPVTLRFSIKDTGCGIAPRDLEHLFEPFVQTEAGHRSQEGTGLGLPISQRFVQLMGGTLTVDSRLGEGSTFTFDIRTRAVVLDDVPTQAQSRQIIGLETGQPTYRILVAEDKSENRRLLVELLAPIGFEVRAVGNGQAAIEECQTWSPHLIWMDIRMPVMNGFEATHRIKATSTPVPVIIALTGSAFEEDRITALSVGCDDFVRKPFRTNVIFEKMADHLGIRYVYAEEQEIEKSASFVSDAPSSTPHMLSATDFAAMSIDWIEQVHHAAMRVNAKQIFDLIKQIPESQNDLINALTQLVDNCCFEEIVELTQKQFPSG